MEISKRKSTIRTYLHQPNNPEPCPRTKEVYVRRSVKWYVTLMSPPFQDPMSKPLQRHAPPKMASTISPDLVERTESKLSLSYSKLAHLFTITVEEMGELTPCVPSQQPCSHTPDPTCTFPCPNLTP